MSACLLTVQHRFVHLGLASRDDPRSRPVAQKRAKEFEMYRQLDSIYIDDYLDT